MKESVIHVWDVHEIVLHAENTYDNPYTDVTVWADLKGPGFDKRVYGFWDGGDTWRIRVTATSPGTWTYITGASVQDEGLAGISGGYFAIEWTEEEKEANACRRGIVRATQNGHAMEYADGTPYVMVGDTWWGLASYRYPWVDDEKERPIGPGMSMKDMARQRISQGYNTVGTIVAFPTWAKDGKPSTIIMDDEHETCIRGAWVAAGVKYMFKRMENKEDDRVISARDMHNEGGRPFFFPGKIKGYEDVVPDYDRINPEYFKVLDKKVQWLNDHGITVFMEALRRDSSKTWKYYYDWPMVYTRYIQYLSARYQANNTIFSPIHYDAKLKSIDSHEFNEPINLMIDLYGAPPFGTLLGTNAPGSTQFAFGGPDEQHWKTMDQIGNRRDHEQYWLLTDIFHNENPVPAINGEPYYPGHVTSFLDVNGKVYERVLGDVNSEEDHMNFRSSLYGSILSGGYGGNLAGFEAGWSGNVEPEEVPFKLWDTMTFPSSYQAKFTRDFLLSEGKRYQELVPEAQLITPNFSGREHGWRGWAYCSATSKRDLVMGYLEKDSLPARVRGLWPGDLFAFQWFNPRTGRWGEIMELEVNYYGSIPLPERPDELDWAFKAVRLNDKYRLNSDAGKDYPMSSDIVWTYIGEDAEASESERDERKKE